ncbi:MAG: N-acetylmuramoyl-L-alanine amidase, partial [Acidobacteriota bacterium]
VADNIDTIRGALPRGVRRRERLIRIWMKRAPLVLVPLTLAGSTYFVSSPPSAHDGIAPAQIVIQQRRSASAKQPSLDQTSLRPIDASVFSLSVHRVVLDAGHGGNDPGAMSSSLSSEKEITLDISRRLENLLRRSGFEVVTTRSDDRLIPLRERARIANQSEGDVFVSIHVNSISNKLFHGVETYYLGATQDPSLAKLAAAENAASGYSLADMRKLLDGVYAEARRDESSRLAAAVQQQLYGGLRAADPGLRNWGVKRAPFVVLVATDMPAILAEVGCISNDPEAAMLHRPEYREQIARALFDGIRAYAKTNS